MHEVAFVKYVPDDFVQPFAAGVYIYRKNDDDYREEYERKFGVKLNQAKIAGYSPVREFFHTNYDIPENAAVKTRDVRGTLYWQPDIVIDGEKKTLRISFFNNDVSEKLKIVVEGINEAGQLIYTEKIIE